MHTCKNKFIYKYTHKYMHYTFTLIHYDFMSYSWVPNSASVWIYTSSTEWFPRAAIFYGTASCFSLFDVNVWIGLLTHKRLPHEGQNLCTSCRPEDAAGHWDAAPAAWEPARGGGAGWRPEGSRLSRAVKRPSVTAVSGDIAQTRCWARRAISACWKRKAWRQMRSALRTRMRNLDIQ